MSNENHWDLHYFKSTSYVLFILQTSHTIIKKLMVLSAMDNSPSFSNLFCRSSQKQLSFVTLKKFLVAPSVWFLVWKSRVYFVYVHYIRLCEFQSWKLELNYLNPILFWNKLTLSAVLKHSRKNLFLSYW